MKAFFLVNSANITASLDGYVRQGKFLKPTISLHNLGGHLELDEGYPSMVLDNSGMHWPGKKAVVTPGSKDASTATAKLGGRPNNVLIFFLSVQKEHTLNVVVQLQATISLSSAEAEGKAIMKGCVEGSHAKN